MVTAIWDKPFTTLQSDSTWKNCMIPSPKYAALLVDPGHHRQAKIAALPVEGNGVAAVFSAKGRCYSIPSLKDDSLQWIRLDSSLCAESSRWRNELV